MKNSDDTKPEQEIKPETGELAKPAEAAPSLAKPPLALVHDFERVERMYSHSDLEGIYRLKIGRRKGLDIWIVDGAKVRRELYIDFILGGNDARYKFIPKGEIWIDNSVSVEELEFTPAERLLVAAGFRSGARQERVYGAGLQKFGSRPR